MNTNYISFLAIFFLSSFSQSLFSQSNKERLEINERIEYANSLIWHINYNIRSIKNYQEALIIWAENPSRKNIDKPEFMFIPFSGEKLYFTLDSKSSNVLFDYNFQLKKIETEILKLNSLCKKVETISTSDEIEKDGNKFLTNTKNLLNQINDYSLELAETSYDFSRACAINYKTANYPTELFKVKNVVSQSKNLILAIRDNNKPLVREFLGLLTRSLTIMEKTTQVPELHNNGQMSLSLDETYGLIIGIYNKAFNISSWAETYLQSSFTEDQTNTLLLEVITEFNEAEGKLGCASGFNTLLKNSNHALMFYTEEPNSIVAENIILAKKDVSSIINNPIISEEFDKNKINTLAGSLPNNLIILLDVSASMKKSGKLPILKKSINHFLNIMRDEDKISLITYSGETKVLVSGASKNDKYTILDSLSKVKSSGGSDVYNALKEAYTIGENNFIKNGNNKIIIASDGIFGVTYSTLNFVKEKTEEDYTLSVFQYCNKNEEINFKSLKNLAFVGQGSYKVIYDDNQAINAMMQEIKKQAKAN